MTIEKLAAMTQSEFLSVDKKIENIRRVMVTKADLRRFATKDDLKGFATKDDLKSFATATKDELKGFATKDDLRATEVKILQAVDKIATSFDKKEKEEAAHTSLHKRITNELHHHDQRIKRLEVRI